MNNLLRDFRHGVRVILKNRGVSAVAVVALALGIGVTATMYSIVYGAMLKGLPFEGGDRVYAINRTDITDEGSTWSVPIHDYLDWRAQQTVFEDIGGYYTGTVNVAGTEGPVRYEGAFVSASTFEILEASPQVGRGFHHGEDAPDAEREPSTVAMHPVEPGSAFDRTGEPRPSGGASTVACGVVTPFAASVVSL